MYMFSSTRFCHYEWNSLESESILVGLIQISSLPIEIFMASFYNVYEADNEHVPHHYLPLLVLKQIHNPGNV